MSKIKYFYGSFLMTFLGLVAACFIDTSHMLYIIYIVLVLALLEISLSFDNAVVNARILEKMSSFWQKLFIWVGMPIAVFGMRLLFPILLVSLTTHIEFLKVLHIAIYDPEQYHQALEIGFPLICAFGGSFLLMVFLHFFLVEQIEIKWLSWFENSIYLNKLRKIPFINILIAFVVGILVSLIAHIFLHMGLIIALCFLIGVLVHEILSGLNKLIAHQGNPASQVAKMA